MMRATAAKAAGWTTIRPLGSRSIPTNAARTTATPSEIVVVQAWARGDDDRALRDARALVSLKHPNLAKIREVVEEDAEVRLVTQFVEGETLAALRRRGPVPLAIELRILVDALTGLSSLHGAKDAKLKPLGFVHSELSPANIVVGLDGVARVIQLAGAHAAPGAQGSDTTSHLAPEILLADDAFDHRVDIYGVGVMLWEALTGTPLFKEKATGAIVTSHLSGRIPKATAPVDAPWAAPLIEVAAKAIATDPRARHASATELAAEIKRIAKTNLAPAAKVTALVKERGGAAVEARKTALGSSEPRVSTAARPKIAPPPAKAEPAKVDEADVGWSLAPPKVDEADVGWSLPPPSYEPVSSRDVATSEPPISLESGDLEDSAVKSRPQPSAHDRITDPNLVDARALDAAAVTGEATVPVGVPAPRIKTMMGLAAVKPAIAPPAMPKPESRDTATGFAAPSADILAAALSAPPAPKVPAAKPVNAPAPVAPPVKPATPAPPPVRATAPGLAAAPAVAPAASFSPPPAASFSPAPAPAAAPATALAPALAPAPAPALAPAPAPALASSPALAPSPPLAPSPALDPIAAAALVERDRRRKRVAIVFLLCALLFCVIAIAARPKSKEGEATIPPPGKPTVAATEKPKAIETTKPAEPTPKAPTATATASVVATVEPPAPTETAKKQADPPPVTQKAGKPTSTATAKPKPTYDPLGI